MKYLNTCLFLSVIIFISCQKEKQENSVGRKIENLYLSKSKPIPGDSLELKYLGDYKPEIDAYYHYYAGDKFYTTTIDLHKTNETWQGKIVIPDSAKLLTFHFNLDEEIKSSSKKGLIQTLYNENGKILPEANLASAYFYTNFESWYGLEFKKDSILNLMKEGFTNNPSLERKWDTKYANLLYRQNKKEGKEYISQRIKYYASENAEEENFEKLIYFYNILEKEQKKDSIEARAIKAFPSSKIALKNDFSTLYELKTIDEFEELERNFSKKYGTTSNEYDIILRSLLLSYAKKGNWKKFDIYTKKLQDPETQADMYNNIAWDLAEKNQDLDKAAELSKESIALLTENQKNPIHKPSIYSDHYYQKRLAYSYKLYADTYAYVLQKQGNLKEALAYQKKTLGNEKNKVYNERYIELLFLNKKFDETEKKASLFIAENNATSTIIDYYKKAYKKTHQNNSQLKKHLDSLVKKGEKIAFNTLKSQLINEEAPAFSIQNTDKEILNLTTLKGKTIIIDFWATWCEPCLASFPAMEEVVRNYKNNTDVVFIFVNTFENVENRKKKILTFIEEKNYPFKVALDPISKEDKNEFEMSEAFKVDGIPTKVIIGPDGKLKFKNSGYSGSKDQLVKELEMMIKMAQSS